MKPQSLHAHEDRLLEFVYGELPPLEARAVESHVEGCAKCSEMLAGIRGVRSTMAQLPMEPAPDVGLESLLAYAQQAARNAAAGPAPKPTWWRRWLMPAMGVAAVTVFGVVTVQVNENLALKEAVTAQTEAKGAEAPAPVTAQAMPEPDPEAASEPASEPPPAQAPLPAKQKAAPKNPRAYPSSPQAGASASPEEYAAPEQAGAGRGLQGMTPPPPEPPVKLYDGTLAKPAPRKKPSMPGDRGSRSEWGNAGAGARFGDSEEATRGAGTELAKLDEDSKKKMKAREPDLRDAMTQAGPFSKPKPILAGSVPGAPPQAGNEAPSDPPAEAQPGMEEERAVAEGRAAEGEAQVQQDASYQQSLRVGGPRSRSNQAPAANKSAEAAADDFDDLYASKDSKTKREQRAPAAAPQPPPPPPLAAAAPAPMPSVSTSTPAPSRAAPATRDESKAQGKRALSSAELVKMADAALRSGDRGEEAQLLQLALDAGASGKERLGLLNRLCDAAFAIGQREAAFEACSQVLEEDPRSSAAQVAKSRLRREGLDTGEGKGRAGAKGPLKAAPVDKMEAPASIPTHAQ